MELIFIVWPTAPGEAQLSISARFIITLSLLTFLAFYNKLQFVACKPRLIVLKEP
jgi:hypothetical protein